MITKEERQRSMRRAAKIHNTRVHAEKAKISPYVDGDDSVRRIPLSKNAFAIVDAADYTWLSEWTWHRSGITGPNCVYAIRKQYLGQGRETTICMHRVIINAPHGMQVDHINGDGLDNRRSNLRLATCQQNQWNRGMAAHNKSGYKGVYWDAKSNGWRAAIRVNGVARYLGLFVKKEDAAGAYQEAAARLHKEFLHGQGS